MALAPQSIISLMLKSCSRCGKIHPYNYKCNVGVDSNRYKTDEDKLRSKYAWTQKSKQIRQDANNLCEVCRDNGVYTYDNLEVHHVTKLREDVNGLLDDDNLICLCVDHHKQADAGEISKDYLLSLIAKRRKG